MKLDELIIVESLIGYYNLCMKDGIILLLIILIGATVCFWGIKFVFRKSINVAPNVELGDDYKQMIRDQRIKMDNAQDRHKQMMRNQKQRIKDLQRR